VNNWDCTARSVSSIIRFSILLMYAFNTPRSVNSYAILLSSGKLFRAISVYTGITVKYLVHRFLGRPDINKGETSLHFEL